MKKPLFIIDSMTRIWTPMQVVIGGVAIAGLDDQGVLHTMVAVVQVVNIYGYKIVITWRMRRKDDRMHAWMIP